MDNEQAARRLKAWVRDPKEMTRAYICMSYMHLNYPRVVDDFAQQLIHDLPSTHGTGHGIGLAGCDVMNSPHPELPPHGRM
jgi:hypothetical protein